MVWQHRCRLVSTSAVLFVGLGTQACVSASDKGTTNGANASVKLTPPPVGIDSGDIATLGSVLVDSRGRTLYRYTPEQNGQIKCVSTCAQIWPPFVIPPGAKLIAGQGVTGSLGQVARPDGRSQATYNGNPLYLYSGD
ncbi:MAG TPA: hypothetical protein VMU77_00120, partial [Acidimicrobiales bacterium]|nr:hypothetical protein [Acidimicrobiales bacterium]